MAGHALIERNNKYLVTRRSKVNDYMPLKWDIPGGIVEAGETLEQAIYREVAEESDLRIKIERPVYIYANIDQIPKRQTFQAVYLCKYVSGNVQLNPLEHDSFKWLAYEDLSNLDVIIFLRELLKTYSVKNI